MRITYITFLLCVLFSVPSSFAGEQCDSVLSKDSFYNPEQPGPNGDRTEQLIGYLGSLFQDGILRLDMLIELESHLSSSNKQSGFKFGDTAGVVQEVHREALNEHLSSGEFQAERILQWLSETIEQVKQEASSREVVATETQSILEDPKFVRIPKGKFSIRSFDYPNKDPIEKLVNRHRRRGPDKQVASFPMELELLQDFEVMNTPVTQGMWLKVMGELPENTGIVLSEDGDIVNINGSLVGLNYPVVNVSWLAAATFANRLSELHGLQPVYTLDTKKLDNRLVEKSISKLRPQNELIAVDAPGGDPYKAEGYRLPMTAEYLLMLQHSGKTREELIESHLASLADVPKEEYSDLRPVDFELPLNVSGSELSDIYGNVRVWLFDSKFGEYHLQGRSLGSAAYYKLDIVMDKVDDKLLFGVHQNPWVQPVFNKNYISRPEVGYSRAIPRQSISMLKSGELAKMYPGQVLIHFRTRNHSLGGVKASQDSTQRNLFNMLDKANTYDVYPDIGIRLVRTLPEASGGKK